MQANKAAFFGIIGAAVAIVAVAVLAALLLRNTDPIVLTVLYSTEKEGWLTEVLPGFDAQVDGRPVQIELKKMGSREIYLSVLDGSEQPDIISPAGALQISQLQNESQARQGRPLVNRTDPNQCRSVLHTPLVLVAWRERAEALGWGDDPGDGMWEQLHDAVVDPNGWQSYGHPEWGFVKFGHTDPLKSNSGFMTILLITYDYFNQTAGLTAADILSDAYSAWFSEMAGYTTLGESTGTFMQEIVAFGPSKYDVVAVYEATAIEQADNAAGRYGQLHIYYPPATVLSDHPFCLLQADWVTPEKAEAGQRFIDYLLSRPVQEKALALGFRPADDSLALDQPGTPFNRYAANGIRLELPPEVEVPPGDVLDTLLRFWERSSRR